MRSLAAPGYENRPTRAARASCRSTCRAGLVGRKVLAFAGDAAIGPADTGACNAWLLSGNARPALLSRPSVPALDHHCLIRSRRKPVMATWCFRHRIARDVMPIGRFVLSSRFPPAPRPVQRPVHHLTSSSAAQRRTSRGGTRRPRATACTTPSSTCLGRHDTGYVGFKRIEGGDAPSISLAVRSRFFLRTTRQRSRSWASPARPAVAADRLEHRLNVSEVASGRT